MNKGFALEQEMHTVNFMYFMIISVQKMSAFYIRFSAAFIQMDFRLFLIMEANTMNSDQTACWKLIGFWR